MLKISIIDSPSQRRLVLEGKLIAPWAAELQAACQTAKAELDGRELVIDVQNVTSISPEGENVLIELMKQRMTFRSSGVFTAYMLRELAHRARKEAQEATK